MTLLGAALWAVPDIALFGVLILTVGVVPIVLVFVRAFIWPTSTVLGEVVDVWIEDLGHRDVWVTAVVRFKNHGAPEQLDDITGTVETLAGGPWQLMMHNNVGSSVSHNRFVGLPPTIHAVASKESVRSEHWLTGTIFGKVEGLPKRVDVATTRWKLKVTCLDTGGLPVRAFKWFDGKHRPEERRDFRHV